MPEAFVSAAGFNQSHMKVAWLAFPKVTAALRQSILSRSRQIYWKLSGVPGIQTAQPPPWFPNFLLTGPSRVTCPRAAPPQDTTRLQAMQSMDDTLMTAKLLCHLPALQLVHQNMYFSVSSPQQTLCPWPR